MQSMVLILFSDQTMINYKIDISKEANSTLVKKRMPMIIKKIYSKIFIKTIN